METPDVLVRPAVAETEIESAIELNQHAQHLSCAVPQTAPFHLRAVAHLYGVETAPIDRARVLELGCVAGGNLLPFVMANPLAHAVGIDLSHDHIAYGNRTVARLGVDNLQLHAMALDKLLSSNLGLFDYIIVHGVFSLVPEDARQAIMTFCRQHMSPLGIACFHYDTYPGAKANEVLRDAMLLHSSIAITDDAKILSARAMLNFMRQGTAAHNPMSTALKAAITQAEKLSDFALAFEYLEGLNTPCYLVDFVALADQEGLAYVGDANPGSELAAAYGDNVLELYEASKLEHNKILAQQYLDFLTGRSSRTSLIVRNDRAGQILKNVDLGRLKDLHWAGSFDRIFTDTGLITKGHISAKGDVIQNSDAAVLEILDSLGQAWPNALSFRQITFNTTMPVAKLTGKTEQESAALAALEILFTQGVPCHYSLDENRYENASAEQLYMVPGVLDLLTCKGGSHSARLTGFNFWHDIVKFTPDAAERELLEKFDGKHNFDQLAAAYDYSLRQHGNSELCSDVSKSEASFIVRKKLCRLVDYLRRQGVLLGSVQAWGVYFQAAIKLYANSGFKEALPYVDSLLMYVSDKDQGGVAEAGKSSGAGFGQRLQTRPSGIKGPRPNEIKEVQKALDGHKLGLAQTLSEELVARYPLSAGAWQNLCRVYMGAGLGTRALEPAFRTVALNPGFIMHYADIAQALTESGHLDESGSLASKVIRIDSTVGAMWNLLAIRYTRKSQGFEAELCAREAVALFPGHAEIIGNLAGTCADNFRFDEAEKYFRQALKIKPDSATIRSNMLFILSHNEDIEPQTLFQEHRAFGHVVERRVPTLPKKKYLCSPEPERRLRIGFVSGDLCSHPVANFIEPIWDAIDKDRFELFAYSNTRHEDAISERLKVHTSSWRSIVGVDDKKAAGFIWQDGIDILCDLSGHTAHNRLPLFAYKPAPIQFTWIGYPGTSGLRTMDYRLIQSVVDRGVLDAQFTEKLVYEPSPVAFKPSPDSPPVNALPALSNDYFTFASFNRTNKIGNKTLALWAKVLHAAPDSKLLIGNVNGVAMVEEFKRRFAALGIDEERLLLRNRVLMSDYLKMHGEVDLLLDTFPYGGGTTTCHALWMGVPTITLAGPTLAGHSGTITMRLFDLHDFVARNQDEYIELARTWSARKDDLANIRQRLRSRMQGAWGSTLTQSPSLYLERAWREMWKRWCEGKEPESFEIKE